MCKVSGLAYCLKVPFLSPNSQRGPADILVEPATSAPSQPPGHRQQAMSLCEVHSGLAHSTMRRLRLLGQQNWGMPKCYLRSSSKLRAALHLPVSAPLPLLDWFFTPCLLILLVPRQFAQPEQPELLPYQRARPPHSIQVLDRPCRSQTQTGAVPQLRHLV